VRAFEICLGSGEGTLRSLFVIHVLLPRRLLVFSAGHMPVFLIFGSLFILVFSGLLILLLSIWWVRFHSHKFTWSDIIIAVICTSRWEMCWKLTCRSRVCLSLVQPTALNSVKLDCLSLIGNLCIKSRTSLPLVKDLNLISLGWVQQVPGPSFRLLNRRILLASLELQDALRLRVSEQTVLCCRLHRHLLIFLLAIL